jgi:hypothetical protein
MMRILTFFANIIYGWPPRIANNTTKFCREKERSKWMTTNEVIVDGLSTDQDDKPVKISASDFVIALQGIFQPLSNYYAFPFEMKGERYRSVEHYAYERLLESLKLDETYTRKLRSTVRPVDVARVTEKIIKSLKVSTFFYHFVSTSDAQVTKSDVIDQKCEFEHEHKFLITETYWSPGPCRCEAAKKLTFIQYPHQWRK